MLLILDIKELLIKLCFNFSVIVIGIDCLGLHDIFSLAKNMFYVMYKQMKVFVVKHKIN